MTDDFHDLEDELRALGRRLPVPDPPDVAAAVRSRLAKRPRPRRLRLEWPRPRRLRLEWPRWAYALVFVLVAALVLGGTPAGRAVVEGVLRFAGVEIRVGSGPVPSPSASASFPGERRMSLEDARRAVDFPLLVPTELGRPDSVLVRDGGRVATLVYERAAQRIRIDEFEGSLSLPYFRKFVDIEPGKYRQTSVGGAPAMWISGPHVVIYLDERGRERSETARTSGNVLLWQAGPVVLRMEGVADLPAARRIGATVRG